MRSRTCARSGRPYRWMYWGARPPRWYGKESWGHLLVYNLLRTAMVQAILGQGLWPRQLSLQGARQALEAFPSHLGGGVPGPTAGRHPDSAERDRPSSRREPAGSLRTARAQASPQAVPPDDHTALAS